MHKDTKYLKNKTTYLVLSFEKYSLVDYGLDPVLGIISTVVHLNWDRLSVKHAPAGKENMLKLSF